MNQGHDSILRKLKVSDGMPGGHGIVLTREGKADLCITTEGISRINLTPVAFLNLIPVNIPLGDMLVNTHNLTRDIFHLRLGHRTGAVEESHLTSNVVFANGELRGVGRKQVDISFHTHIRTLTLTDKTHLHIDCLGPFGIGFKGTDEKRSLFRIGSPDDETAKVVPGIIEILVNLVSGKAACSLCVLQRKHRPVFHTEGHLMQRNGLAGGDI